MGNVMSIDEKLAKLEENNKLIEECGKMFDELMRAIEIEKKGGNE